MSAQRMIAYRALLFFALLDIRRLAKRFGGTVRWWNLRDWFRLRRDGRCAGEVADWLHNLAKAVLYEGLDQFDEVKFWRDYEKWHCRQCPDLKDRGYREHFEYCLADEREDNAPRSTPSN